MNFKLKVVVTACILGLAACGGGSDSPVSTEGSAGGGTTDGGSTGGGGTGGGGTGGSTGGGGTGGSAAGGGTGGSAGGGNTGGSAGGGGTGGSTGGGSIDGSQINMPIRQIDYATVKIEPTSSFSVADANFCTSETDKSKIKAYAGHNTVTYTSSGVSDVSHLEVARYAEASVAYIKTKLGLDDSVAGFNADGIISICVDGRQNGGNSSAGDRVLRVVASNAKDEPGIDQPGDNLKALVLHELIHVSHNSLSGCRSQGVNFLPKWFSEGSALLLAGQDFYHPEEMADIRKAGNNENPYSWIGNGYPNFKRYPAYRLAVEALVKDSGGKVDDLWDFTKSYFAANPCSSGDIKFNPAISAYFGNLLDNPMYVGKFWTETLEKYVTIE